jgi:hypothetical protein
MKQMNNEKYEVGEMWWIGRHKTFGAHEAICSSNISKRLINYVINTYDNINDFNLVDLFHHQETTIL